MIESNVSFSDKKKYAKALERLVGAIYKTHEIDEVKRFLIEKKII